MLDVYMFGVFVAVVKLSQLATISPGTGLYAYVALFLVWTAALAGLDAQVVWSRIGPNPSQQSLPAVPAPDWIICPLQDLGLSRRRNHPVRARQYVAHS